MCIVGPLLPSAFFCSSSFSMKLERGDSTSGKSCKSGANSFNFCFCKGNVVFLFVVMVVMVVVMVVGLSRYFKWWEIGQSCFF